MKTKNHRGYRQHKSSGRWRGHPSYLCDFFYVHFLATRSFRKTQDSIHFLLFNSLYPEKELVVNSYVVISLSFLLDRNTPQTCYSTLGLPMAYPPFLDPLPWPHSEILLVLLPPSCHIASCRAEYVDRQRHQMRTAFFTQRTIRRLLCYHPILTRRFSLSLLRKDLQSLLRRPAPRLLFRPRPNSMCNILPIRHHFTSPA